MEPLNGGTEGSGESFPWEDGLELYEAALWEAQHGDQAKARSLLIKAAAQDWHEAQFELGVQLFQESITGGDSAKRQTAIEYLKKAAFWNPDARSFLATNVRPETRE